MMGLFQRMVFHMMIDLTMDTDRFPVTEAMVKKVLILAVLISTPHMRVEVVIVVIVVYSC